MATHFADAYFLLFLFIFGAIILWGEWNFGLLRVFDIQTYIAYKIGSTFRSQNTTTKKRSSSEEEMILLFTFSYVVIVSWNKIISSQLWCEIRLLLDNLLILCLRWPQ